MGRPNLLLFTPDQLRADALGCFGSPVAQTPHLDALARRGTRFHSAWSQHSVCGPSRVSIMTGWYPHTAGHRTLDHLLKPWEPNLLRCLRDAGYDVAMPGTRGDVFAPGVTEASTDFCGHLVEPTWSWGDMRPAVDADHPLYRGFWFGPQGDEPRLDGDEAAIRTAIRWLEERTDDRPWALWVPLLAPHPPFMVEEPWYSMHERADMPAPLAVEAGLGKPAYMDELRRRYGWDDLDDGHLAEIAATYHGMVSRVDDQFGRLLAAVDRCGHGDDTVTFVFSDHGEYLGDYRLVEKWPSGLDPRTCLELAGVEAGHTHFGRSLTGLFADPEAPHRDAAFCEGGFNVADEPLMERAGWVYRHKSEIQHDLPHLVAKAECVRTPEWTYVYRQAESDELYDRRADPDETTNLLASGRAGDADVVEVVGALRGRLLDWLVATSDAFPWEADPRFPDLPHGWRDGD